MTGRMSGSRRTRKRFPGPDAAVLVMRSAKVTWWASRVAALYGPFRRLRTSSYDVRAGGETAGRMGVGGILHVCTANQIRSPMAERMVVDGLRRQFGDVAESVLVMSAGIRATAGEPMQPRAIDELTRRGISSGGFGSTP